MDNLNDIVFFTVIAGRKHREALLKAITENGGRFINVIYGKGTVNSSSLTEALGFVPEENKVVITYLLAKKNSANMIEMLTKKFNFDKPNTGIAFSVPVGKLSV